MTICWEKLWADRQAGRHRQIQTDSYIQACIHTQRRTDDDETIGIPAESGILKIITLSVN